MLKSIEALKSVVVEWKKLEETRPNELDDLTGFEDLRFKTFDDVFSRWKTNLEQLARSKWMEAPEASLVDTATTRSLNEIASLISQATGNHGVNWLLSTSDFLMRTVDVGQRISTAADRRTGIAKSLAKELGKATIEQAGAVIEASKAAKSIRAQHATTNEAAQQVEQAKLNIESQITATTSETEKLAKLRTEIEDAHNFATEKKAEVKSLHDDVVTFRTTAETKSSELERKIEELTNAVADAKTTTADATSKLSKALANVRKQGLAGAFRSRGTTLLLERIIWIVVFVVSLVLLFRVAQSFAGAIPTLTYEALLVALLRRLALAAPLVWLGWYSAKQLGRLGRIQEDYEYKAATALAFEGYRREVEASGDESLMNELLKTTIGNFGANPVRLYDQATEDAATPTEELISRVESDGTLRLLALLQKFNISRGGH